MKTASPFASLVSSIMVLSAVVAVPAFSQSWPAGITPVRGVVASVSGDVLTVSTQSGLVNVHLGSPLTVYRTTPSDLAHVNSKSFVGVTSLKQPDGSERATEINIFPEELRGIGEGSYLMNPDQAKSARSSRRANGTVSSVTEATVTAPTSRILDSIVSAKSGASTLSVQYSVGVQTISVPPNVT